MLKYVKYVIIFFFLFSCKKNNHETISEEEKAKVFLTELINTMEQHSLNRKSIDWTAFRKEVLQLIDKNRGYQGNIYLGVVRSLTLLGDNHSSFTQLDGTEIWGMSGLGCWDASPVLISLDNTIGYVKVGTFKSMNPVEMDSYISSIHKQIELADNRQIIGWIIDLRNNKGGSFYPMLQGVAPILGAGTAIYWFNPDNTFYPDGIDTSKLNRYYQLYNRNPKVAILTDKATASAGEAVAICFKGRLNTRSFGNSTCGVSTWRTQYVIAFVGTLDLSTAVMADRNKTLYGRSVIPDELEPSSQLTMQKAVEWLKQ